MAKKFKIITSVKSNEVSLCSKYNSGANKQTEFELVKNKDVAKNSDMKDVLQNIVKLADFYTSTCECEQVQVFEGFKEFIEYWVEYDVNNVLYDLLSDGLRNALENIKYVDLTKEEKIQEYQKLFNSFIEEYKNLPITKTKDGKYEVSLVSKSHNQEVETIPQNETQITKENGMNEEQQSLLEKAFETIKSAFNLAKTETPAEQEPEETVENGEETKVEAEPDVKVEAEEVATEEVETKEPEETTEEIEKTEEVEEGEEVETEEVKTEEGQTEEEQPLEVKDEVLEEAEGEQVETEEVETEEETELQKVIKQKLEVEKELAELKKAQEEKQIEIEKMSFVQKAKDEYSMLVGTSEEIGAKLYSISKSNLDEESKSFVFEQLKKVSSKNEELTIEKGSQSKDTSDASDEEILYAKAEEIAKTKGISINKALREVK